MAIFEKERKALESMRCRCNNPNDAHYKYYGGRGITLYDKWADSKLGFALFIEHIGPCPSDKHSIDRMLNDEGYKPGNVRWATKRQQARNRRSTHDITFNGKTQCLQAWADEVNLKRSCLLARLTRGWEVKEALTTPSSSSNQQKGRNDKARQDTGMHLKYKEENLSLRQWSKRTGISMQTIRNRIKKGVSLDLVFKPITVSTS